MTPAEDTDHLSQTTCMHLGAPCPALTKMLQTLAAALSKARGLTDADFEFSGDSVLGGCARHCPARFVATHDRIRVFCDVTPAADTAELDLFADTLLMAAGPGSAITGIKQRPCAFGEVRPRPLHQPSAPKDASAVL
jgi:predicted metal-binding protein